MACSYSSDTEAARGTRRSNWWLGQFRLIRRVRLRANLFTFPEHLGYDNNAEFFGFLDGQRVKALTQHLEARRPPFFDHILCGQRVLLDGVNLWSVRVNSLDCNGADRFELVLCRDREEVNPMLERGIFAI